MTFKHWYLVSVNIRPLRPIPKGSCNARCVIRLRRNQIPNKTLSFSLCHLCVLELTYFHVSPPHLTFKQEESSFLQTLKQIQSPFEVRISATTAIEFVGHPRVRLQLPHHHTIFFFIWFDNLIDISNQNVSCVSVFLLYFFLTILYFNLSSFNERWQISFSIF